MAAVGQLQRQLSSLASTEMGEREEYLRQREARVAARERALPAEVTALEQERARLQSLLMKMEDNLNAVQVGSTHTNEGRGTLTVSYHFSPLCLPSTKLPT